MRAAVTISLIFCLFNCSGVSKQVVPRIGHSQIAPWQSIKHVVIIILENGSPIEAQQQPFMNEISKKGANLKEYYGITHPSQPNYIAMIAGSTLGVRSDKNYDLKDEHIGDMLERAGKTWKIYAEDYPGNCFLKARSGNYARKHVPFLSFTNVQNDPTRCENVVAASQFDNDVANNSLKTYSMYIPNLLNDAHDTDLAYADSWFKKAFAKHFKNPQLLSDTLFIITFDEDDMKYNNRIYTVFLGAGVKPGVESIVHYDHYSMLRTVEEIFNLDDLGRNDLLAQPIMDIWK